MRPQPRRGHQHKGRHAESKLRFHESILLLFPDHVRRVLIVLANRFQKLCVRQQAAGIL